MERERRIFGGPGGGPPVEQGSGAAIRRRDGRCMVIYGKAQLSKEEGSAAGREENGREENGYRRATWSHLGNASPDP